MFDPKSRYYEIPTKVWQREDGSKVVYIQRRFLPLNPNISGMAEHTVDKNQRLDHIAAQYLGNPELFWHLCDVNNALQPADLTAVPGQTIKIPLQTGI